jgi:transposase
MVFTISDVCGASPNQQALRTFCLLRASFPPPPSDVALAENPSFSAFSRTTGFPYPGTKRLPGRPWGADSLSIRDSTAMARSPELARLFQLPDLPAQRHYEICRAYFHDETPADQIAQRLHLHVGSVRAIVRDFARDPDVNAFFATARPGRKTSPKRDAIHQRACELRRQGATLADIRAALQREGFDVSESYLFRILHRAGLATTRQGRPLRQPGDFANDTTRTGSLHAVGQGTLPFFKDDAE